MSRTTATTAPARGRARAPGAPAGPTAYFPPAFPYSLGVVDLIDGHQAGGKTAVRPERVAQAVVGTVSVGLLGLVALEVFGGGVAVAALGLAAVYPVFVELSGTLVAENLLVVFELAAIWAALRARRAGGAARTYAWIAATGILTGLATLTHENAAVFVLPLGVAAWSAARARAPDRARRPGCARMAAPAVLVLCACAVIAPWTVRNAVELHHFVPVSDETGITLIGTYNATSAASRPVHYKWDLFLKMPEFQAIAKAAPSLRRGRPLTPAPVARRGLHPGPPALPAGRRLPQHAEDVRAGGLVRVARLLRRDRPAGPAAVIGVVSFWVLLALAIAGLFTAVRREAPGWLWAFPVLYWLSITFVNVETPRFREPIDPFLVLLAACAVATAARRVLVRLGLRGAPVRRRGRAPELAGHDAELVKMVKRLA